MKNFLSTGAALLLTTSAASALGLDRSGQGIGALFESGNYAELTFGSVSPEISGNDVAAFGGIGTGNVGEAFTQFGAALKQDINEQLSFALIFDQPYGADVAYTPTAEGGSVALGGTAATVESTAVTALLRYRVNEQFSVHGGLRAQTVDANVTLDGLAYGPAAGYNVDLQGDTAYGYSVGVAYEKPEIALRVALTYISEVEHEFTSVENGAPSLPVETTTPQAINLDFQTGVAADTLVFGTIRWAEYSVVNVTPFGLGSNLTDLNDGVSYNVGVGRRFSDTFSGSISVGYEAAGSDSLASPLSPTNGNYSVALGGQYAINDNVTVSGGVRYVVLGDAEAQTSDTARSEFRDNNALGFGLKVGYTF